jgi:hypothetical protein
MSEFLIGDQALICCGKNKEGIEVIKQVLIKRLAEINCFVTFEDGKESKYPRSALRDFPPAIIPECPTLESQLAQLALIGKKCSIDGNLALICKVTIDLSGAMVEVRFIESENTCVVRAIDVILC